MGMRFSERFANAGKGFADQAASYEKQGIEQDLRARLEAERIAREGSRDATLNQMTDNLSPEFLASNPDHGQLAQAFLPAFQHEAKYGDPTVGKASTPIYELLTQKLGADAAQKRAEAATAAKEVQNQGKKTKEEIDRDIKLTKNVQDKSDAYRKEFTGSPEYKLASDTKTAYDQLVKLTDASAKSKTGTYDMATIFQFMKGLDPRSTVRESEYAKAENLSGPFGRMWKSYNKLRDGKSLSAEEREDMKNVVRQTYLSSLEGLGTRQQGMDISINDFNDRADDDRYKINREAVLGGMDYTKLKEGMAEEDKKYQESIYKYGEEIGSDPKKFSKYFDKDDVKQFMAENQDIINQRKEKLNQVYQKNYKRPMTEEEEMKNLRKLMVIEARKSGKFEEREPGFFEKMFN